MIKNTSTVDKNILINEVLNNHLYVDKEGFLLRYILEDYQNHPYYATGVKISLYYDNGFPIALAFYDSTQYYTIQVFTKKEYRNKGIAQKLVSDLFSQLDDKEKRTIRAGIGEDECCHLWLSLVKNNVMNEKHFDEFDVIERKVDSSKVKFLIESFRKAS